jgi:hypothetical protein
MKPVVQRARGVVVEQEQDRHGSVERAAEPEAPPDAQHVKRAEDRRRGRNHQQPERARVDQIQSAERNEEPVGMHGEVGQVREPAVVGRLHEQHVSLRGLEQRPVEVDREVDGVDLAAQKPGEDDPEEKQRRARRDKDERSNR